MARLIIVNADDLGYDPAIDRGILEAASCGVVRSATLLANLPRARESLSLARGVKGLAVGLHLNFARGPALAGPSMLAPGGELDERSAAKASEADALLEARAQLARFAELAGRGPTHLDVHKHLHRREAIFSAVARLALERGLPVRALDPAMRASLRALGVATTDAFFGDTGPTAYWSPARLIEAMEAAPEGATELMCHPGFAPTEVRTGYGAQRESELAALKDPAVVERARRGDLRLGTFADLPRP